MSIKFSLPVLLLLSLYGEAVNAQDLKLREISVFAAEVCVEVEQDGTYSKTEIKGNLGGKLSGLAKILGGEIGAGGEIIVNDEEFDGVRFDQLSEQVSEERACRQEIVTMLLQERRNIQDQGKNSGKDRVASCIAEKVREYENTKTTSVNGGARASGPGWKGGTRRDQQNVCHRVGANQEIIGATTSNTCCHGGRCSVTAPSVSENNKSVCITTKAWSDSTAFGGGGCAKYNLVVDYKDVATEAIRSGFEAECL